MIPNELNQEIDTVGTISTVADFRITAETMPRLLVDLSDKLYSNKLLAVIREYSTNAADAMTKAGKSVTDIIVTLPTWTEPNFKIRDFGAGLSEEEIADIYCVLGASTKRNSNSYNGMFGYGCKSGFACADSFFVTSIQNGQKITYQCIKGDTTKPHTAIRLSSTSTEEEPGVEISIPIELSKIDEFHTTAANYYRYWDELPQINTLTSWILESFTNWRNTAPTLKGNNWELCKASYGTGVVYMGYVAYPINWDIVSEKLALSIEDKAALNIIRANDLIITCEIGTVTFQNSREALEYTDQTLNFLNGKIEEIISAIKKMFQTPFESAKTIWDAKLAYNGIFRCGHLDLDHEIEEYINVEGITLLSGDLNRLEKIFGKDITWNGIKVESPSFRKINKFDNSLNSIQDNDHNPSEPVLVSFRKKKSRVKQLRCTDSSHNFIVASPNTALILNDMGVNTGIKQVAQYLLFNSNSKVKVVQVLTFKNDELKNKFYKEYHFDTVPFLKLSDLIGPAKVWKMSNKTHRSYVGGNCNLKFLDLNKYEFSEEEISPRSIDEGGVFLRIAPVRGRTGGGLVIDHDGQNVNAKNRSFMSAIKIVTDYFDLNVERVYIIGTVTFESKWFQRAIKDKEWVCLWDMIDENISELEESEVQSILESSDVKSLSISLATIKKIKEEVSSESKFREFANTIVNINADSVFANGLKFLGMLHKLLNISNYQHKNKTVINNIKLAYPLLGELPTLSENITEECAKKIAHYIKCVDVFENNVHPAEVTENS